MSAATKPAELGRYFRAARTGAGLSQRSLCGQAEVSHTTLCRWERGERDISLATYGHLIQALADFMARRWAA